LGVVLVKPETGSAKTSAPSRRKFTVPEARQLAADLQRAADIMDEIG
jgi:hypothetical protein